MLLIASETGAYLRKSPINLADAICLTLNCEIIRLMLVSIG